jgi:Asp/Glu/hydantoin racemase
MSTIALIHASRASVDPVTQHFNAAAPELKTVNLLDDGVMSMLADLDVDRAVRRLAEMVELAWLEYRASAALVTCSAVSRDGMRALRANAKIPIIKIDEPMTRRAAAAGRRIGIVATFPATVATTVELLHAAALAPIETTHVLAADALNALLRGDMAEHDRLLLEAAQQVECDGIDAIVLAQVSMARLEPQIREQAKVPVFSSLATSLDEVRALLAQTRQ